MYTLGGGTSLPLQQQQALMEAENENWAAEHPTGIVCILQIQTAIHLKNLSLQTLEIKSSINKFENQANDSLKCIKELKLMLLLL